MTLPRFSAFARWRSSISLLSALTMACAPVLRHQAAPLQVRDVRFEAAPQLDGMPSTLLIVRLANEGSTDLSRIVVRISVFEKRAAPTPTSREPAVLAGPYTLIGNSRVLRPGQTIDFELRLKNLSSEQGCSANVDVLSVESTSPEGRPRTIGSRLL
jgi:hypothetical protein